MKKVLEIFAWTVAISTMFVIVFVRAPKASGVSGGQQASKIIESSGGAISKVISSLQG